MALITETLWAELGRATCAFANLRNIASAADVEERFPWISISLGDDPMAAKTYNRESDELRRLLDGLVALDGDLQRADEFRERLLRPAFIEHVRAPSRHFVFGDLRLGERGFELDIPPTGTRGVRSAWLLFLDGALEPEANRRFLRSKRIRKCGWSGCPAPYRLIDRRTGGRPWQYHSPADSPDGRDHKKLHFRRD
jgi:hypothetical protein